MDEIRLLTKDDIDVRVAQTTTNNGGVQVSLLLFKDARVDMKILDELFTPMGWKRTHKLIGDRLYCQVEVWDSEKKEWICKEDVGVESNTEAEKGQASDSFKRACVNWGIGRELYTAPKIRIDLNEKEYSRDQNGKIRVWASFSVNTITYDKKSRSITSLEIVDNFGRVRYSMTGEVAKPTRKAAPSPAPTAQASDPNQPQYTPVSPRQYWNIVKAYAEGRRTKSGGDYRTEWARSTNAGTAEILKFDKDVADFQAGKSAMQQPI